MLGQSTAERSHQLTLSAKAEGPDGKYAQFITHKGKRILFVNAARLPEEECLEAFEEMKQAILKEGKGSWCWSMCPAWR